MRIDCIFLRLQQQVPKHKLQNVSESGDLNGNASSALDVSLDLVLCPSPPNHRLFRAISLGTLCNVCKEKSDGAHQHSHGREPWQGHRRPSLSFKPAAP